FLNPLLYQELLIVSPGFEVYCFASIDEGIRHFAQQTGEKAEKLPTPEESKEIKKELEALPPIDWVSPSVDNAAMQAIRKHYTMRVETGYFNLGSPGSFPLYSPQDDPEKA